MSFRCEACRQAQPPRAKPDLLPVEFRPKEYRNTSADLIPGYEVAREVKLCASCAEDIRPTVDQVVDRRAGGDELQIMMTALKAVGRKELGV